MIKKYIITFVILYLPLSLFSSNGVDTTGADFLKISTGARPISMGETFCAVSGDINNINVNPAGLEMIKNKEVTFMHMGWLDTMNFEYLAYAHPTKNFVLGGSIIYFYLPSFIHFGNSGEEVGELNVSDFASTFSFVKMIFNYSFGINFKFIHRRLVTSSALGWAFDIGVLRQFNFLRIKTSPENNLSIGFVIQNLGPKIKFLSEGDSLPLNFKFGIAYNIIKEFLFAIDFTKPTDKGGILCNLGSEYTFKDILSLRCGYKIGYEFGNFSTGIGIRYKVGEITYFVDYALMLSKGFNNIHAISIKLGF